MNGFVGLFKIPIVNKFNLTVAFDGGERLKKTDHAFYV